jgi:hypothetical protein
VKHPLSIAIVVVWIGMAILLVRKQTPAPAIDVASLPPLDAPGASGGGEHDTDEWFGVYQGERKIGHAHRVATRSGSGWKLTDESSLAIAMLGTPQPLTTRLAAETDDAFALRTFSFTLVSPAATFTATGRSDGRRLEVSYGVDGRTDSLVVPLDEPIRLPGALRPRIAAAQPAAGTRFAHTVFSPLTLRRETSTSVVEGRETIDGVETLRLAEEQQGLTARVWLTSDGRAVREEGALGFVLRAEPRATALAGIDSGAPVDLALATRIPLTGRIDRPRDADSLTFRVSGSAANLVPDDPPRQRMRNGILRVTRDAPPAGGPRPEARYTAPSPFVESDDPAIVARAGAIVGDETDPAGRARRLLRWVRTNMTQSPSLTVPSAREVLRTLRGDCNEHAVLLTALARAAGIPARVVAGVVYQDGDFFYHAWSELWLDGWISADAVFAQMPADATHVKLLEGGPEVHAQLARLMGRLSFATAPEGS